MVLPPVPNPDTGFHALWPGMEPTAQNFVFQNVVDDDQPDGTWAYSVWYGPYDSAYVHTPSLTNDLRIVAYDETQRRLL